MSYEMLNSESLGSIPFFDKMATRGYITNNSQEGIQDIGKYPLNMDLYVKVNTDAADEATIDVRYRVMGGKYKDDTQVLMSERAYVCGLLDKRIAEKFHHFINKTDILGISPEIVKKIGKSPHITRIPLTYDMCSRFIDELEIFTSYPQIVAKDDMKNELEGVNTKYKNIDISKYVIYHCTDMQHGRNAREHLYPIVIKCLEEALHRT